MGNSPHSLSPFFLTRQSANILEDLARLTRKPASICLVHGVRGVGKTRLLMQFIHTRCIGRPIVLVRFGQNGQCKVIVDQTSPQASGFSLQGLNELPADAVLLLDDFQFSSNEARLDLLNYWQAHALARKQNMIIAGDQNTIDPLRDLCLTRAQPIDSVKLAPLNYNESLDYLSRRLCPHGGQVISVSREERRQVQKAGGLFASLDLLAQQPWPRLRCGDRAVQNGPAGAVLATTVVAAALLALITYALLNPRYMPALDVPFPDSGISDVAEQMPIGAPLAGLDDSLKSKAQTGLEAITAETEEPHHVAKSGEGEMIRESAPSIEQQPAAAAESDLAAGMLSEPTKLPVAHASAAARTSLLQTRMQATHEWLRQSSPDAATIQIMTLIKKSDPEAALQSYLRGLTERGFDIDNVYVYRVTRNGVDRYVVLYGEYADRNTALDAIDGLPDMLKRNGPLPRTVRGLRSDIAR